MPIPAPVSSPMSGVAGWVEKKIILRRGTAPKQLAFSASLGVTLGIFPICGSVTPRPSGRYQETLSSLKTDPTDQH
ncbi:hypothetical protein AKJ16_DCAP02256 [Drosera capensis]